MIRRFLRRLLLPIFRRLYLPSSGERVEFQITRDSLGVVMDIAAESTRDRFCVLSVRLPAPCAAKLSRHLGRASYDELEGPEMAEGDYEIYD